MPRCLNSIEGKKCDFGWSLDQSEVKYDKKKDLIKIHPKPCPKCGNPKPNVGPGDKKKAKALSKGSTDKTKVEVNPGGALTSSLEKMSFWLSTNESPPAPQLCDEIAEADGDFGKILESMCSLGPQIVEQKYEKPENTELPQEETSSES